MIKKILACTVVITILLSMVSLATFSDMPQKSHWSYAALNSAVETGLLTGSGGMINPNNNLTRAEMATILVRAYGLTEKADISMYKDVPQDAWYYEYMQKACAKGLFKGDDSMMLNPENNITRQEVFVVLGRALNLKEGEASIVSSFSDKDLIASWAVGATAAMVENNYIKGSGDKINPTNNITRAEFAQIMFNLKNLGAIAGGTSSGMGGQIVDKTDEEEKVTGGGGGSTGGGGSSAGGNGGSSGGNNGSSGNTGNDSTESNENVFEENTDASMD